MNQDDLKKQVAQAAKEEVLKRMPKGQYLGIGTGSTANWFIDLLAPHRDHFAGVVSSSLASTERLIKLGFHVVDASQLPESIQTQSHPLPMYVDGADEINPQGHMIKGGGGALTREKIIASLAKEFICICDESKQVNTLGKFPLPLEVIPPIKLLGSSVLDSLPKLRQIYCWWVDSRVFSEFSFLNKASQ